MSERLDLAALRSRLAGSRGSQYWRSLEEAAERPEFQALLQAEFPRQAAVWPLALDRRQFLSLMGASLALAGLGGCTKPPGETIVPYVEQPETLIPGRPLYFATALTLSGVATGVLVESHMGRPTKIEGNPDHPASRGATDLYSQAAVLTLYDPDRLTTVLEHNQVRLWEDAVRALQTAVEVERPRGGAGLRILTETVASPTLAAQIGEVLRVLPNARWHQYEPCGPGDNVRAGAQLAFGADVRPRYRLDQAAAVLALDADVLACTPANLRYVGDFARRRRVRDDPSAPMNRLYVVESGVSLTGAKADHRLPLRASEIAAFAGALAARLGVAAGPLAATPPAGVPAAWLDAVAEDLRQHRGAGLVIIGEQQPPAVHALAHALNEALGNAGRTVEYAEPSEARAEDQLDSLRALVADMQAGRVRTLIILGGNPAYTAPADLRFADALLRVARPLHLTLTRNETSVRSRWVIPAAHELESWSDARAWDGTVSLVQPLIAPLYDGVSAHELLAVVTGQPLQRGHDIVRAAWQGRHQGPDFEAFWRRALHTGVVANTATPARAVRLRPDWAARIPPPAPRPAGDDNGLEIVFAADPSVYDGRFANNGWLQELPDPH